MNSKHRWLRDAALVAAMTASSAWLAPIWANAIAPDLIQTVQPQLEAAVRHQMASAPAEQLQMQWSWSAPRGAATAPCPGGWHMQAVKLQNLARIAVPVVCGHTRGSIVAQLALQAPVWTLARDMPARTTLHPSDVRLQVRPVRALHTLLTPEMLQGAQLRKAMAGGSALQLRDVERPPLLQRADTVEIRASDAGVSVHVAGEAMGSARLGDVVRVRNIRTHKVLEGRLVEPDVVLVEEAPATGSVKVLSESSD